MPKIRKITESRVHTPGLAGFNILGDPGCDELGASTMAVFAKALTTVENVASFVIGDLVPTGRPASTTA